MNTVRLQFACSNRDYNKMHLSVPKHINVHHISKNISPDDKQICGELIVMDLSVFGVLIKL